MITKDQLTKIYLNCSPERIDEFLEPLNQTMGEFEINTPQRTWMFLSQIGHESGELRYVVELASGEAYEGRSDLGNVHKGDGIKYKGRGLIQITGLKNYLLCGLALDLPLEEQPALLEQPLNAARSAGWYWNNNNLNALADAQLLQECTRRINGGLNGLANRYRLYQLAITTLPIVASS